jgi:hypothetical protein
MAVIGFETLAQLAKIEKTIDLAQEVICWNVPIEIEGIEKSVLISALCSHHQEVLPDTA